MGTSVTINGTNFSTVRANNKVSFNGIQALVTAATADALTVTVPDGATTGVVSVSHAQLTVTGPVFTVAAAPTITDFSVGGAAAGESIVITGANYSATGSENSVAFNGVTATITAATITSLTVTIPTGALTGPVSVEVFGQVAISSADFYVTPTVASFDPITAETDTEVTITGLNFSSDPADNTVEFNGTAATVTASTLTSITATVPGGATTGPITIEVNGLIGTSSTDFTPIATGPVTLTIPINASSDDVEESISIPTKSMTLDSSDLELGEFDTSGSPDLGVQNIGLRFNGIAIPPGATILSATIQFTVDASGDQPVEMTIFGENVGNAVTYTSADGDLSARTLTTANAVWNIPEWASTGDNGDAQKTVDIASIIQEIVDRGDWAMSNSLNIILKPTGNSLTVTSSSAGREAETFDGDAAPILKITFE